MCREIHQALDDADRVPELGSFESSSFYSFGPAKTAGMKQPMCLWPYTREGGCPVLGETASRVSGVHDA